jgi:hypothetical protein
MMVVDLQGVRTPTDYVLTDPVILCEDVCRFGSANLGPLMMKKCVRIIDARLARAREGRGA